MYNLRRNNGHEQTQRTPRALKKATQSSVKLTDAGKRHGSLGLSLSSAESHADLHHLASAKSTVHNFREAPKLSVKASHYSGAFYLKEGKKEFLKRKSTAQQARQQLCKHKNSNADASCASAGDNRDFGKNNKREPR